MFEQTRALLALWNDVDPAREADYNAWHAVEHVPERLTVPGMLWGLRFRLLGPDATASMPRYLTLYGLAGADVLDSAPYQRLLREPTPASAAMRPALRDVSRWVCAISHCGGKLRAARLAVWALAQQPADDALRAMTAGAGGWLCGRRIEGAAPLPWLGAGQAGGSGGGVEGQVLVCAALADADADADAAPPGATVYIALPVG